MRTWTLPAGWLLGVATGAAAIGLDLGVAPLAGVAIGGALVGAAVHRRRFTAPLAQLRDELEAAAEGVAIQPTGAAGRSGLFGPLFEAASRVAQRAAASEVGRADPWGDAAAYLDAHGGDWRPPPSDPRFEAALSRLVEREQSRAFDLYQAASRVAHAGVGVLDALEGERERWQQLAVRSDGWHESACALLSGLEEEREALSAARVELLESVRAQAEAERRLEEVLRGAASRLNRIAALESELTGGKRDLEQLERLINGLGRASDPQRRLQWVGEARATLAHWAESRASWADAAARARDQLGMLADATGSSVRLPEVDATLDRVVSQLARLSESWSQHSAELGRLARLEADGGRTRAQHEAQLRRGVAELALLESPGGSGFGEDALLERLRLQRDDLLRAVQSPRGASEETQRLLFELEARGARARARLDDVVRALHGERARAPAGPG